MMNTLFDIDEQIQQQSNRAVEPATDVPSHMSIEVDDADGEPIAARFTYVDEDTCIGCKNCAFVARNTFFMEESFAGKARVFNQGGDSDELIEEAIDTCPVNCIHYVSHEDLVTLEKERLQREASVDFNNYAAFKKAWTGQDAAIPETKAQYYGSLAMGSRCNNCPSRGCAKCPMFGVGKNPVYQRREKVRLERKKKSGAAAREAADREAQQRIDILYGRDGAATAGVGGAAGALDDDAFAALFADDYIFEPTAEAEAAAPEAGRLDAATTEAVAKMREVLEEDSSAAVENLDPYAVLGVTKDASLKDIKRAFRRLAMKWHPDRCAGLPELERLQAELIFKQINLANEVLSNEAKRRRYDAGSASLSELCAGFWENLLTKMQGKAKAPPLGGDGNVKGVVRVVPGSGLALQELAAAEEEEDASSPYLLLAAVPAEREEAPPAAAELDADGNPRKPGVKYDAWGRPMA